jgi:hypothetical protein
MLFGRLIGVVQQVYFEILYHDGIDLNNEFKDTAAMCYSFGALDLVNEALIPT